MTKDDLAPELGNVTTENKGNQTCVVSCHIVTGNNERLSRRPGWFGLSVMNPEKKYLCMCDEAHVYDFPNNLGYL